MKTPLGFMGTYFDRGDILRFGRLARFAAWAALIVYGLEAGYNVFQSFYNAISGGYPVDPYLLVTTLSSLIQGVVIFVLLNACGYGLLILLDIEDNTRRASRIRQK